MVQKLLGLGKPEQIDTVPREIRASAAALGPDEEQLETVFADSSDQRGFLATTETGSAGAWPEDTSLEPGSAHVEGWVAGPPVVKGVADNGWKSCESGRVRVVIQLDGFPERREWVRPMAYGGSDAREVLGEAD